MARMNAVNMEAVYQDLLAEHKASQKQLHSKDEALKIFQKQMKEELLDKQRLEQEIKQLHSQLARTQMIGTNPNLSNSAPVMSPPRPLPQCSPVSASYDSEREGYILELETAQEKNQKLSRQIQLLEDEKEELASERDYYSGKCAHLVKCFEEQQSALPSASSNCSESHLHSTYQNIIEENRQLRLNLIDIQAERDQALCRIERYKKAVERRKAKEACGEKAVQISVGSKKNDMQLYVRRIAELESIGNSLSESVKEKTTALAHQKRANKILASRITELEHKLRVFEMSCVWDGNKEKKSNDADDQVLKSGLKLVLNKANSMQLTVNKSEGSVHVPIGELKLDESNSDSGSK